MAINKITNEQRELMRQKSAQSLPDVPSSKGWTPKNFKDAMTKPLFDNENSFFAFYNALVEQIENIKFDKEDYDFKNLGTFENERAFAQGCEDDYSESSKNSKNFAYKGYIVDSANNQYTAFGLAGHRNGAGQTFDSMVITQKGITCYQQGNEVAISMPKVEASDVKVNTNIEVPAPVGNENAVNKYYLEENHYNKNEIDSSFQNVETNLNYNIQGALDSSKSYTDLKYVELKRVLDTILNDAPSAYDTLKKIADYIASDKTGASEMLAKINNNTSEINVIKQGLPTTVDIILRSEVSEGTTEEVKEMEINGMKFKIGSATSSDSAIKGKLVASGTIEIDEDTGEINGLYNFENGKYYSIYLRSDDAYFSSYLGHCYEGVFETSMTSNVNDDITAFKQQDNYAYFIDYDRNILNENFVGIDYKVYELVAPVGSGGGVKNDSWEPRVETHTITSEDDEVFNLILDGRANLTANIIIYNKRNGYEYLIENVVGDDIYISIIKNGDVSTLEEYTFSQVCDYYIIGGMFENTCFGFINDFTDFANGDEVEVHYVYTKYSFRYEL